MAKKFVFDLHKIKVIHEIYRENTIMTIIIFQIISTTSSFNRITSGC